MKIRSLVQIHFGRFHIERAVLRWPTDEEIEEAANQWLYDFQLEFPYRQIIYVRVSSVSDHANNPYQICITYRSPVDPEKEIEDP